MQKRRLVPLVALCLPFLLGLAWQQQALRAMLARQSGPDLAAGRILHLKFDNTVTDSSGNGFDCTFAGAGPTYVSPLIAGGNALDVNGTDDICTITQNATINDLVTLTVAAHVNFDTFGEGAKGRIFDKDASLGGMNLFINDVDDRLVFQYNRWSTTDGTWRTDANTTLVSTTYCLVVTYDASSTANDPTIYIDGTSVTVSETGTPAGTLSAETDDLTVGNNAATDRTFDGRLDDFRVYNTVWTQAHVDAYCNL